MNRLPIELVSLIAEHLKIETGSTNPLLFLNKRVYNALLPMVFTHVELSSDWAVQMFCWAVCISPRNPGNLVQTLKVGTKLLPFEPNVWGLQKGFAERLRFAFFKMPRLRELTISASATAINKCFYDPKIPFKLQKLEVPCINSRALELFLTRQSDIRHLRLVPMYEVEQTTRDFLGAHLEILPRLDSLTAPMEWLQAIAPKRALSELVMDNRGTASNSISWDGYAGAAPLLSAGIYYQEEYYKHCQSVDPWLRFLTSLRKQQQDQDIVQLVIYECFMGPVGMFLREAIVARLKTLRSQPGFPHLERLTIELADREIRSSKTVSAWLGEMKYLDNWKKHVPRLKSASVYGVEVV